MTNNYSVIAENTNSTVVSEFTPAYARATSYQSEADLEQAFVELLQDQAYEYLAITSDNDLVANLRLQLEKLNNYQFSDTEWEQFFITKLANANEGIEQKTAKLQEDHIQLLTRDDGEAKNIYLIDKANIHNNRLQVINQYEAEGNHTNRYDVTVLVNGLPMVHVELKRRGVALKEAFNQIDRYQRDTFWADSGLFEYVQLFVVSNGTFTKYYSNTTRLQHIKDVNSGQSRAKKKTSHSFEFTSWWADANNRSITDLMDFGKTFFANKAKSSPEANFPSSEAGRLISKKQTS